MRNLCRSPIFNFGATAEYTDSAQISRIGPRVLKQVANNRTSHSVSILLLKLGFHSPREADERCVCAAEGQLSTFELRQSIRTLRKSLVWGLGH